MTKDPFTIPQSIEIYRVKPLQYRFKQLSERNRFLRANLHDVSLYMGSAGT